MTDDGDGGETIGESSETRELRTSRVIEASPERVYRAFVDPDELEQWFVPEGMTAEVRALEPEPGGAFVVTWVAGDDRMDQEGTFEEVVENERLVTVEETDEGVSRLTYEFHDVDGGTEVVLVQEFPGQVPEGADEGWANILDRLEEVLVGP